MANVKVILLTIKKNKEDKHPVVLRVTQERKRQYFFITDANKSFSCTPDKWDASVGRFKKNFPEYKIKNGVLENKESEANEIILKAQLEDIPFTFDYFRREFTKSHSKKYTVFNYFDDEIDRQKNAGKIGNSIVYKCAKFALKTFNENTDLRFTSIDYGFLKNFESHLFSRGVKRNSVSVYMRTLRAVYNSAIKNNYVKEEYYPFSSRTNPNGYSLEGLKQTTAKRAISKEQLKKILKFNAEPNTRLYHSKNIFMFSFYCMGMNFHDIAHLKWANIINGRIEYNRAKTGGFFSVGMQPEIKEILDYYKKYHKSDYVFPILTDKYFSPEKQYLRVQDKLKQTNKDLKIIADAVGIDFNITTYVARHSWANIQRSKGRPMSIIGAGLGHKTEEQTDTYLISIDNNLIDEANKGLLE